MNWEQVGEYEDIFYHKSGGIAKVTINRPHKRNAFLIGQAKLLQKCIKCPAIFFVVAGLGNDRGGLTLGGGPGFLVK